MSDIAILENPYSGLGHHELNAMLNLFGPDGKIQFSADKQAARRYHLDHVNNNTVFFHDLEEKRDSLIRDKYWDPALFELYEWDFIKSLFKRAYGHKFRFPTFMGAFKFYMGYALKTFDGKRYIERYEDRVCLTALFLGRGDEGLAQKLVDDIILGRFQPATPTFLNAGKAQRGELVSCFLLRVEDNMESISRSITNSLQLSKKGGGVALNLTNLRETGAPIKLVQNQSSGVIPIMKLLEDSFSYANQLGARQGAGAVYLNAHHPDILRFLDTKRENADEKVRIKTLSLGVVVPDITFELARNNADMYLFSPYDVERVYSEPFDMISVSEKYDEMVDDARIKKTKINARELLQTIAEIQFESGYPYIMFEDAANRANPIQGRISMSNLCSEILQVSEPSTFNESGEYEHIGQDISCNLGSLNIAAAMDSGDLGGVVETAIRALSAVAEMSDIQAVPPIARGNFGSRAVGLGQMNLHGYLGREQIHYGSPESIDFVSSYFAAITFHALRTSNLLAIKNKASFEGFEHSTYATGAFFDKYTNQDWLPVMPESKNLFDKAGISLPSRSDWVELKELVVEYGLWNRNLQAVPPTGSISYINNSTSSIHPIASAIEIRKEGQIGRVYYPAPNLTSENGEYFKDAYEIGYEKIIDVYAAAGEHVDQGLSLTLFFKDTATTRDINKAQIYAWRKGLKSLYYIRVRQTALEGTEAENCVSCML